MDKEQDAHQPTDMDEHEETLHGEVENFQDEVTEAHEVKRNLHYHLWKKLMKVTFWTKREKKLESKGKNVE
jgi:hypothetical protein